MSVHLRVKKTFSKSSLRLVVGFVVLFSALSGKVAANPIGPSVVAGGAAVSGVGTNQVIINQTTPQAILSWQQFNIAPNEVTRFIQPSAQAIALNRIFGANPSQIFGSLQANGRIILLNPNGVLFGPGAQVNVNGLIASSLDLKNDDFLNGRYRFGIYEGSAVRGPVMNTGTIEAGLGGVYLFAPNVSNNGIIRSPEGKILLAAGATVYLSQRADGNGLLWEVSNTTGEAANLGTLIADGGQIGLYGRTVRQAGLIQANSVREKNGRIELVATDSVDLKAGSRMVAMGGSEGASSGGTVIVRSDKKNGVTSFEKGAEIDISGGPVGGDAGFVELSGGAVHLGGISRGIALPGFRGGRLLLDPYDLQVDETLLPQLAAQNVQTIDLQADHDITVVSTSGSSIELSGLATGGFAERTLNFLAGNDLRFNAVSIFSGLEGTGIKWTIKGNAGNDIIFTGAQLWIGNGGGFDFEAKRDILLQADVPSARFSSLWALAGGDIHLKAGRDIIAPSPYDDFFQGYAGIRLVGVDLTTDPVGNLTIEAGRDFLGGFTLANGTAKITTGGNFGRSSVGLYPDTDPDFSYANLILGQGSIEVSAAQSIYLGRVQDLGLAERQFAILDPGNKVTLTANTGDIHLNPAGDTKIGNDSKAIQISGYYPPSLIADAKNGSIFIERNLTFWPSLTGSLDFSALHDIQGAISGGQPTKITLLNADPDLLHNHGVSAGSVDSLIPINPLLVDVPDHPPASVRFHTEQGDISTIQFRFKTALHKQVEIFSGRDLKQFAADLMIPEGTEAVVHAERDISMNSIVDAGVKVESGIFFSGTGTGRIYAGGNLDLGNSNGIQQRLPFSINRVATGLIDISVGGDLRMTTSGIYTYNGASLSIHGIDGPQSAVGGVVNVGTNDAGSSVFLDRGIATIGGGSIDIIATGDVNVNASRVATFGGGDIHIVTKQGNINAGFGSPNDTVEVGVPVITIGPDGFPELDAQGNVKTTQHLIRVPGSGIFTFHNDDPNPLPPYPPKPALEIPRFEPTLPSPPPQPALPTFPDKTPKMIQMETELLKQRVLGHDTSKLEAVLSDEFQTQIQDYKNQVQALFDQYQIDIATYKQQAEASYQSQLQAYKQQVAELQTEANQQYEAIKAEHRKDWKLGDIELTAKEKSVIVPPAGIRGKKITIVAKTLDLQGGEIGGDTSVTVDQLIGDQGAITGPGDITVGDQNITEVKLPSLPTFTLPTLPTFSLPSIPTGGSAGSASLGGLSGATGSLSAGSSGSVTAASSVVASVQEKVAEQVKAAEEPREVAESEAAYTKTASADGGNGQGAGKKGSGKYRKLEIRKGVFIQVEVHDEQP